ncbi:MAG: radical SAM protein [Desulfobulbaceae bacterium]|nr:radical SAM protein [Desulfobulbaceae bacterium]
MHYKAIHADWEITMGCNMRCRHCGSSCSKPLAGQLDTKQALRVCDEIGDLGLKHVTLTGGEPLIRHDWHLLVERLRKNGVIPKIMTNGWMLNQNNIDLGMGAGIDTFIVSIDGDRAVHDVIRRQGSYDRVVRAFHLMSENGIRPEAITAVHKMNLSKLKEIRTVLQKFGVKTWHLQSAMPMGNLVHHSDKILEPDQFGEVIDFIHESVVDQRMDVIPGHCFGYYGKKDMEVRPRKSTFDDSQSWQGCDGGKRGFGILHNGDIVGCCYIRDKRFVEGNVEKTSLAEIWHSDESFAWNRRARGEKLPGLCGSCKYGDECLGGCTSLRLTMNGSVLSENRYCSYNQALFQAWQKVERIRDVELLTDMGMDYLEKEELQLAHMMFQKALEMCPDDLKLLGYYGYASFLLHNFNAAREANEKILAMEPDNVYANEGLGVVLSRGGDLKHGIEFLCKAAKLTTPDYMAPWYDMAVLLAESGRLQPALQVIQQAEKRSPGFKQKYLRGKLVPFHKNENSAD